MQPIYIFGHKKPDTDSICATITLSNLKNQLGENTIPCTLGYVNDETNFVLNYFNVKEPTFISDVKLEIKDIHYQKEYYLKKKDSIYKSYQYMLENKVTSVPIVDEETHFYGLLSMKDIAKDQISGKTNEIHTSYQNIMNTLEGTEILRYEEEIEGNIIVPTFRSTTFIQNVKITPNDILIVGDRHSIIEYAISNKAKLLIITGDGEIQPKHLEIAKENKVSIIYTKFDSFKVAKIINLCNYNETIVNTQDIICFKEHDKVTTCQEIAAKNKYSNYPIINEQNTCLGLLRLADINNNTKKQVILVDHNHYEQSADGLEEAEILEIIDHHNIGNLGTTSPINFRNMPVGSSNSIIYLLYTEHKIEITKTMAGLMLAGILSDTLLLKSPTTTELDKQIVAELTNIAQIDYQQFGLDMFKAGSSLKGKTIEQVLYTDFKNYNIKDRKIGLSQIFTMNIDEIKEQQEQYIHFMNTIAQNEEYHIVCFLVTDFIQNGSYIFYNEQAKELVQKGLELPNLTQGTYIPDCVSRKKQVVPKISNIL